MTEASTLRVDILLLEDNTDDVKFALRAFSRNKLTNTRHVIGDGVEALDFIFCRGEYAQRSFEDPPKVILLDLKLPLLDGLEVLREIRADPRNRAIPVVMMTSSREERDRVASYQLGLNSYIVKPLDFEQFVEAIRLIGLYCVLGAVEPAAEGVMDSGSFCKRMPCDDAHAAANSDRRRSAG